ncbi:MAG: formate dehydrogenase accessory protein FdhE [Pseudodesulfovibrio sp.]
MEFDMDKAERTLVKKMGQLRAKSYISVELVDLLDKVAHLQLKARAAAEITVPKDGDLAPAEAVLQGMSLVSKEYFPYDVPQAEELLGKLLDLLKETDGALADAAKAIGDEIESGKLSAAELFDRYLSDDVKFFAGWAERCQDAPKTIAFLAQASLSPSIEAAAEILAEKLPEMKAPSVGTCPICGSLPLISSLKEKEGYRHATCSFCRHDYRIKRLACPVCGEEDQKKLTFFTVEEEPGFRVDVCESCKTYIKTIDFRDLDRVAIPVLDDLDSLALDYVAAGQGYKRATLSAWGF